jgi:type III restriction enzyme/adenine-specific DNA-methyltransferase
MIKDAIQHNEHLNPNDKQLAVLRQHFPGCFSKDGSFDIEKFKASIADKTNVVEEGYKLRFLGESYAKLLATTETTTVIQPNEAHNSLPENANSQNIYISGDNLDALKHLRNSYSEAIKCIYIDPPYNTGNDGFVYQDNFNYTAETLQEKLNLSEAEALRILDLTKRGSASHSAWLMFMYSRLLLSRDLLKDDGVIFISIDDNEQANLKILCDDVFGEENFVGNLVWKSRQNKDNRTITGVSNDHEYVICYTRNHLYGRIKGTERKTEQYANPDSDPRGLWVSSNMVGLKDENERPNLHYVLIDPNTGINYGKPKMGWRYDQKTMSRLISEERILWPNEVSGRPRRKVFLNELGDTLPGYSSIIGKDIFTRDGAKEIDEYFNQRLFDFPKPSSLIKELAGQVCDKEDIVLDCFSGSGSTANAVHLLNAEDEGNRKFISVQLPEKLSVDNPAQKAAFDFLQSNNLPTTLDYIGIERIKRAAAKIKQAHPDKELDLGFKHYILAEPAQNTLDKLESFSPTAMLADTTLLDAFGKPTILATWHCADGYGLTTPPTAINLAGYTAYHCQKHLYFIEPGFTLEHMKALLQQYESIGQFNPENIVLFGYSFPQWSINEMIEKNLRILNDSEKNLKINLIVRY